MLVEKSASGCEFVVDGIPGEVVCSLILGLGHRAVDTAKIDRACTDIHDQRVGEKVESIGDGKGL